MRLTIGLSSFQHCQNSGTSRCASETRRNEPSANIGAANRSGYMPQPYPARTAAPNPSAVGTHWIGLEIARRNTLRTNISCSASSRFHASESAVAAASAVKPSGRYRSTQAGPATGTYRITPSDCTRHPGTGVRSVVTAPNHRTLTQQPRRVVLVLDPDRALTLSWLFSGLRSDDHIDTRTVLN